jgi:hypothetical protein
MEGLALEVANLLLAVREYLNKREDNLGMEWEVVWVEKVVCRVIGVIKMLMVAQLGIVKRYCRLRNRKEEDKNV